MIAEQPTELDAWEMSGTQAVALWLAAGYCYEIENIQLISDDVWHALCARIDSEYETLEHPAGHHLLIERASLATGTCSYLKREDYPPFARGLAQRLAADWLGARIPYEILPPGRWETIQEPFW